MGLRFGALVNEATSSLATATALTVMLFHVDEGSETVMFPKGLSFYLPPKAAHVDASVHVDEQVLCWGGKAYYAWLVIYYTLTR